MCDWQDVDMNTKEIVVVLAETEMAFRLHFAGTEMPFLCYERERERTSVRTYVKADLKKVYEYKKENRCSEWYAEYCCLMNEAGNVLLQSDRVLFHGVAMIYKGRGYVLTAPSGTGKTTQFRNLHAIYGEECRIISGDKPVLRRMSEDEFWIYPSPWNGKENWAGNEIIRLHAVVWLEQGNENLIEKPDISDMVLPCLSQIIYSAPNPGTVHEACRMAEGLLRYVPIYKYTNTGDLQSSKMLGDFLNREAE